MMTIRFSWVLPFLACCFGTPALPVHASPAVDMSFEAIRSRAEEGDPYYQAALAFVFLHGEKGQPKSIDQFRNWTIKSAAQAHPLGLFAMGYLGKIDGDPEKTRRYYRRAFGPGESKLIKMAAAGDALASYCLGELFVSNVLPNEIEQDTDLAALHFHVAADRGHQPSRVQYAVFRIKGWGVEKNEPEGFAMLLNVAEQNLPSAHYFLSHAYFEGWGVEKNYKKAAEPDFESIFDGKSLAGWAGDPKLWSVQDGATTGVTTNAEPVPCNKFLIWEDVVANFELRAKVPIIGNINQELIKSRILYPPMENLDESLEIDPSDRRFHKDFDSKMLKLHLDPPPNF